MRIFLFCFLFSASLCNTAFSQISEASLKKVWRINLLNPGVDFELPVSRKSVVSINPGIGYGGSYKNLTVSNAMGVIVVIAPFVDLEWKYIYNRDKRLRKDRELANNAGNYWGLRFLARGEELFSNVTRTDNFDFSIAPVWGIQRSYGPVHLLFDAGLCYYFDTKGNSGMVPELQLNVGFDL